VFYGSTGVICCRAHATCDSCLRAHLWVFCQGGGARLGEDAPSGAAGGFPCPMAPGPWGCGDGALPVSAVLPAVCDDPKLLERLWAAGGRAAVERYRRDEAAAMAVEAAARKAAAAATAAGNLAEWARVAATAAMTAGQSVCCPRCGAPARKDDGCVHMRCGCGTAFCYVCGEANPNSPPGGAGGGWPCGCDAGGAFLESMPGWEGLARPELGETPAAGALAEFHRHRIARLLRVAGEAVGPAAWAALRRQYPRLLVDVGLGRAVGWGEIAGAEHPAFGTGRARHSWAKLEDGLRAEWVLPSQASTAVSTVELAMAANWAVEREAATEEAPPQERTYFA
jgi:hypothetical protein